MGDGNNVQGVQGVPFLLCNARQRRSSRGKIQRETDSLGQQHAYLYTCRMQTVQILRIHTDKRHSKSRSSPRIATRGQHNAGPALGQFPWRPFAATGIRLTSSTLAQPWMARHRYFERVSFIITWCRGNHPTLLHQPDSDALISEMEFFSYLLRFTTRNAKSLT